MFRKTTPRQYPGELPQDWGHHSSWTRRAETQWHEQCKSTKPRFRARLIGHECSVRMRFRFTRTARTVIYLSSVVPPTFVFCFLSIFDSRWVSSNQQFRQDAASILVITTVKDCLQCNVWWTNTCETHRVPSLTRKSAVGPVKLRKVTAPP